MCIRDSTSDSLAGNYLGFTGLTYYRRLTEQSLLPVDMPAVSYTHLRAHETVLDLVCRLLLGKKKSSA